MKHGLSIDNRAEHDMTYDADWAAIVPLISAQKKNTREDTYQSRTFCVEQMAAKSVVREATTKREGVR
jgi:hypothetical protein